ncbi:MAG: murein biosynthesis integral membrane protein MurJ [Kiritimatiellae bacterium]|nr:murein biosynthesis integral membrane protein MurJ [Kiritimatiellia bacterium]
MAEPTPPRAPPILGSVAIVSAMTAISRILGLVREIAMGYLFGTSPLKSAFDMAFTTPNLFRRLFGEGALSNAFIPIFNETLVADGKEEAWRLASRVLIALTGLLATITLLGILLTFPLARILPPGSRWLLPIPMLRVMLPYALLICLAGTLSGVLNSLGKFAVSSLTPALLNLFWLGALILLILFPNLCTLPERQLMFLCFAILLAGLAQILFQLPELRRQGFRFALLCKGLARDGKIRRILTLMGPAAIGMGVIQINVCLDKFLAYWADTSAPAALEYAERITYLPLGMFATAFMTVLLPTFSRQASNGAFTEMRETLERAIRQLGLIMTPCSLALLVLAPPVIQAIYAFKGGHFNADSVTLSARALAAYAPGLLIFSLQKVFQPAFYGMQDVMTPLRVSLACLALNVTLNISSIILLPVGWKHCGIAGSTVLTSLVNSVCLFLLLKRKSCSPRLGAMVPSLLKSLAGATVMAFAAWNVWRYGCRVAGVAMETKPAQLTVLALTVFTGITVYAGMMFILSRRELRDALADLKSRKARRKGENHG